MTTCFPRGVEGPVDANAPLDADSRRRVFDEAACTATSLPPNPSLVGLDATARDALGAAARDVVFAVRYGHDACLVTVRIIDGCKLPVKYRYARQPAKTTRKIRSAGAMWNVVPMAVERLRAAFIDGEDFDLEMVTAGRYALDPQTSIRRAWVDKPACAEATHIVTGVDLGSIALRNDGGKTIDQGGDPAMCGDPKQLRPEGCSTPLKLSLLPIAPRPIPNADMVNLGAFEIDRLEVPAGSYATCVDAKKCSDAGTGRFCTSGVVGKEDHPINCIDWGQAGQYCKFAGKRLPTGDEWALMAKRGESAYPWGDEWPPPRASGNFADRSAQTVFPYWVTLDGYDDGFVATAPVDKFSQSASPSGAIQVAGTVSEWVEDRYKRTRAREIAGSNFGFAYDVQLKLARRDHYDADKKSMYIGVRCAR